jgi:predicted kinase
MAGKIIVLKGLPACGKSTYAKKLLEENPRAIRLNKDSLREMMHFGGYNGRNERYIVELEYQLAEKLLSKELTVVVDDTNLNPTHINYYKALAEEHSAEFEIKEFNVSVGECCDRDINRRLDRVPGRAVGVDNIVNMAHQFGYLKQEKMCEIFDLDGTLTNLDHRRHLVKDLAEGQKPDWDKFFSECGKDVPRKDIIAKMHEARAAGHEVIICSARPEDYRDDTQDWLSKHGAIYDRLIMRKHKDYRKDTIVKKEMLDKYLCKSKIVRVYDDRPVVIDMWRDNGLEVVDVGDGISF